LLRSGHALELFRKNVEAQGGEPRICDEPEKLLDLTAKAVRIESSSNGFVTSIDTFAIGNAVAALGGGRVRIEDPIDPAVGYAVEAGLGDELKQGDVLGFIYCRDNVSPEEVIAQVRAAYTISEAPPSNVPELIKEVIEA